MIQDYCRHLSRFLLVATLGTVTALQAQLPECRPFLEGPRLLVPGSDPALRTGAGAPSDDQAMENFLAAAEADFDTLEGELSFNGTPVT